MVCVCNAGSYALGCHSWSPIRYLGFCERATIAQALYVQQFIFLDNLYVHCAYINTEYLVPSSEEEFEAVLNGSKRFQEVSAAHQQVADMLTEDCSHLLRKAQAAVNKAGGAK